MKLFDYKYKCRYLAKQILEGVFSFFCFSAWPGDSVRGTFTKKRLYEKTKKRLYKKTNLQESKLHLLQPEISRFLRCQQAGFDHEAQAKRYFEGKAGSAAGCNVEGEMGVFPVFVLVF